MVEDSRLNERKKEPHILSKEELEQAKAGMKDFLALLFEAQKRGPISVSPVNLGNHYDGEGIKNGVTLTHSSLVNLWDLGWDLGLDRESLKALSTEESWQKLCKEPTPTRESDAGWSHSGGGPGTVG